MIILLLDINIGLRNSTLSSFKWSLLQYRYLLFHLHVCKCYDFGNFFIVWAVLWERIWNVIYTITPRPNGCDKEINIFMSVNNKSQEMWFKTWNTDVKTKHYGPLRGWEPHFFSFSGHRTAEKQTDHCEGIKIGQNVSVSINGFPVT